MTNVSEPLSLSELIKLDDFPDVCFEAYKNDSCTGCSLQSSTLCKGQAKGITPKTGKSPAEMIVVCKKGLTLTCPVEIVPRWDIGAGK